jgi:hypothetical protein
LNCHSGFQKENAKKINKRKMSKDRWIEEKGEKWKKDEDGKEASCPIRCLKLLFQVYERECLYLRAVNTFVASSESGCLAIGIECLYGGEPTLS